MGLAGFSAARLEIEDTRLPHFPISSIFSFQILNFFVRFTWGV